MRDLAQVKRPAANSSSQAHRRMYRKKQLGAIAARWDQRAPRWDSALRHPACHLNEDDAYADFLRQATRVLHRRQGFCQTHGVIDLGCGTGLVLTHVVPGFRWGVGVDISPEMIRAARRKRIPKTRFIVGDCFDVDRLSRPAGAIFSRGVLLSHYGPEHAQAFLAAGRSALVEGGFFMCDFLNKPSLQTSGHRARGKWFYSASEARRLGRLVGFKKVRVLGTKAHRALILLLER